MDTARDGISQKRKGTEKQTVGYRHIYNQIILNHRKGVRIMGLIKAGIGALGGTLADQWKEFFYCESMPKEVLVTKGQKRISGRSSNTKGNDNIISNGSGIAVADGQCMIIVEQGKINPENLHMTPPPSRLFLPAVSGRAL